MITIEQVEYLKSKANISYEEAKGLLEKYNGDMLVPCVVINDHRLLQIFT